MGLSFLPLPSFINTTIFHLRLLLGICLVLADQIIELRVIQMFLLLDLLYLRMIWSLPVLALETLSSILEEVLKLILFSFVGRIFFLRLRLLFRFHRLSRVCGQRKEVWLTICFFDVVFPRSDL